jgi:hypothetical protein
MALMAVLALLLPSLERLRFTLVAAEVVGLVLVLAALEVLVAVALEVETLMEQREQQIQAAEVADAFKHQQVQVVQAALELSSLDT